MTPEETHPQPAITIQRTGNAYHTFHEFAATYPDGTVGTVWTPLLIGPPPEQETWIARKFAQQLFKEGRHTSTRVVTVAGIETLAGDGEQGCRETEAAGT